MAMENTRYYKLYSLVCVVCISKIFTWRICVNNFSVVGVLQEDAKKYLVQTANGEKALVVFFVIDKGMPYQRREDMIIEVNFIEEAAIHILPYLKKGKEVVVFGFLTEKISKNSVGRVIQKKYVSAKSVQLVGGK